MNVVFFGSSLLSAYWNGAATYYRGIIRALHERGHRVKFYEPDAWGRQKNRDIAPPDWAEVVVYANDPDAALRAVESVRWADLVVKTSGVGVFDELLEAAVLQLQSSATMVAFWDVDAPATLERMFANEDDSFRALLPRYDAVFTYGGGDPVVRDYTLMGARRCVPIYNAVEPRTHHPVPIDKRFRVDLSFLGNRLPDREERVQEFFFSAARALPARKFLLGGSGWESHIELPPNVRHLGHVFTADHNASNCSPLAVLNIARSSMARYGFSPATRVFEACGAGSCLITDAWEGVETFFEPNEEILVARSGAEVAEIVNRLSEAKARQIGTAARQRALAEHTYTARAKLFDHVIEGVAP